MDVIFDLRQIFPLCLRVVAVVEIVDHRHRVAELDHLFGEVGTYEAGTACDEEFHRGSESGKPRLEKMENRKTAREG